MHGRSSNGLALEKTGQGEHPRAVPLAWPSRLPASIYQGVPRRFLIPAGLVAATAWHRLRSAAAPQPSAWVLPARQFAARAPAGADRPKAFDDRRHGQQADLIRSRADRLARRYEGTFADVLVGGALFCLPLLHRTAVDQLADQIRPTSCRSYRRFQHRPPTTYGNHILYFASCSALPPAGPHDHLFTDFCHTCSATGSGGHCPISGARARRRHHSPLSRR